MARETILVVDSDSRSRRVLEVSFKKEGYRVATAESLGEAGTYLESNAPDLIVSEVELPDGDGLEFLAKLQSRPELRDIPFLFLTDDDSLSAKVEGLDVGADDYLTRPIFIKEVLTRVRMLLDRRGTRLFSEEEAEEFTGRLSEYTLIDLLRHIDEENSSGVVHIERGDHRGDVIFREGQPVDAVCGKLEGEAAIYRMMKWEEGAFRVTYGGDVDVEDHIDRTTDDLLAEGLDRLEMWHDRVAQLPDLNTIYEVDYDELAEFQEDAPDEVGRILRLFDGYRTLDDVVEDSPADDLATLSILERVLEADLLIEVDAREEAESDEFELETLSEWLKETEGEDGDAVERSEFLRRDRQATRPGLPTLDEGESEHEGRDRQLTEPRSDLGSVGVDEAPDRSKAPEPGGDRAVGELREEERRRRREEAKRLAELRSGSSGTESGGEAEGRLERDRSEGESAPEPQSESQPRSDRVHEVEAEDEGAPISFEPVEDRAAQHSFEVESETTLHEKASELAESKPAGGSAADAGTESSPAPRPSGAGVAAEERGESRSGAAAAGPGGGEGMSARQAGERQERISPVGGTDDGLEIERVSENGTVVRAEYELPPREGEPAAAPADESGPGETGLTWEDEPQAERRPVSEDETAAGAAERAEGGASPEGGADEEETSPGLGGEERSSPEPTAESPGVQPESGGQSAAQTTEPGAGDEAPSGVDSRESTDSPTQLDARFERSAEAEGSTEPRTPEADEPGGEREAGRVPADESDISTETAVEADESSERSLVDDSHEERFFESGEEQEYDFEVDEAYASGGARWKWWGGGVALLALGVLVVFFVDPLGLFVKGTDGTGTASESTGDVTVASADEETKRPAPTPRGRDDLEPFAREFAGGVGTRAERLAMVLGGKDPFIVGSSGESASGKPSGGSASSGDSETGQTAAEKPASAERPAEKAASKPAGPQGGQSGEASGGSDVDRRVESIKSLVRSGRVDTAYRKLQDLQSDAPGRSEVADLYPRVGSGFQRSEQKAKAEKVYREYLEKYPDGRWAGQIRSILKREFK
ncbi:MAG: response regulator [Bradymonadaceae bacterium]